MPTKLLLVVSDEMDATLERLIEEKVIPNKSEFIRGLIENELHRIGEIVDVLPNRGAYQRYDVPAIKRAIGRYVAKGDKITKDEAKKLRILKAAVKKLEAPGRNVLTKPQREAISLFRLAQYGQDEPK